MADVHTKKQRSYNMSRIKCRDTKPEIVLRKLLFASGARGYRLNYALKGKPDIVFPKQKLAIFVDGCFWHKCPKCFHKPATNKAFWLNKIESNVKRDKSVNSGLNKFGWKVMRFWEHDLRKDLNKCCQKIVFELSKFRKKPKP